MTLLAVAAGGVGPATAEGDDILKAVVGLRAEIPANARTARFLGARRQGSGVVVDNDGLILTIGPAIGL